MRVRTETSSTPSEMQSIANMASPRGTRYASPRRGYRIYHLVPLELAGASDARNLWPQRLADNELKDRVEPGLHEEVCGVLSAYDGTSSNAGRDRARLAVLSR
jgi:hypothetical protein